MSVETLHCWNCGQDLDDVPRPISRHEQCPQCFEAVHCCRLCVHYQPNATGNCNDERADPPLIKENANFCEYFKPSTENRGAGDADRQAAARARLDALFSKD